MQKLREQMEKEDSKFVFAEVPLLFESNSLNYFNRAIVVLRPREERIRSVMERDKTKRSDILSRIENQYDYECFYSPQYKEEDKILLLKNDGDFSFLKKQTEGILRTLFKSLA